MDRWMEFFTTPGRIRRLDSRRLVFLAISVVAFVLTEIVRRGLRPGLRSTGGIGLTLTNSIGNLGGVVVQILVEPGQTVEKGQSLLVLEAMKMQNEIQAPHAGTVTAVRFSAGDRVEKGELVVEYDVAEE